MMSSNEETLNALNLLYDKTVKCPICDHEFKVRSVRSSSYRIEKKDSDFFIHYTRINPYFYDVWLCNSCGYAAMKADFPSIRSSKKELILANISTKWHSKEYPSVYDSKIAIERYKLALINYTVINSESYKKAMNCLKIAWMYRLSGQVESENAYIKNAIESFSNAYYNEGFPMYGMNRFTVMYLIGELNRRIGNPDEALTWFGNVLTSSMAEQKIKEIARTQKDLIKNTINTDIETETENHTENKNHKKRFSFRKLF